MIVCELLTLLGGFTLLQPLWVNSAEMRLDCPFGDNGEPAYIRSGETVPCNCIYSDPTNPHATVKWIHPDGYIIASGEHQVAVNFAYNPDWYDCDNGWTFYPEATTCLKSFVQRKNWTMARADCQEKNGDLVKITNADFMEFILGNINNGSRQGQWIGLQDLDEDDTFNWLDESAGLTFTDWANGKPDNRDGNKRCGELSIYLGSKWNDKNCDEELFYICQKEPVYTDNQNKEYTCKATSDVSGATVKSYTPRFATGPTTVNVSVANVEFNMLSNSGPIDVQCVVDKYRTNPKPNVTIQGVNTDPIQPVSESETASSWTFNFNFEPLSGNNYTAKCVAENTGAATVEAEFNLTAWGPPNVQLSGCPFADDGTTPAYVLASSSSTCSCTMTDLGNPEGEAVWLASGAVVSKNNPTATINLLLNVDGVQHSCLGRNTIGDGTSLLYTPRIAYGPTAVTAGPSSVSSFQMTDSTKLTGVGLTCHVTTTSFSPDISVKIVMSSGETLNPVSPFQSVLTQNQYSFTYLPTTIQNVTAQCVASNSEFPDDLEVTQSISIGTLGGQMLETVLPVAPIIEGNSTSITCKFVTCFEDSVTQTFSWKLNGVPIDITEQRYSSTETVVREETLTSCKAEYKDVTLVISEFRAEHIGDYECELSTSSLTIATGNLHINQSDVQLFPQVDISPKTVNVTAGTNVTFACQVSRATGAKFTVLKIESPILTLKSFNFEEEENSRELSVDATVDISMTVTCVASNKFYTVESEAVVTVDSDATPTEKLLCAGITDDKGTAWPSIYPGKVFLCEMNVQNKIHVSINLNLNVGVVSRSCKSGGLWDAPKYFTCILKEAELVNSTTTELLSIANVTETPAAPEDLTNVIDLMDNLSRTLELSFDEASDNVVIQTEQLEVFAGVTSNLLSASGDVWEATDNKNETTETETASPIGKLVATMDLFAKLSLKEANIDKTPVIMDNIVIKREILTTPTDIQFPAPADESTYAGKSDWVAKTGVKCFLPFGAFGNQAAGEDVGYAVMLFKNVHELLGPSTKIQTDSGEDDLEVVSEIISISLSLSLDSLDEALRLEFQPPSANYSRPKCVYLQTKGTTTPYWSSKNCATELNDEGKVVCRCNHLTSFTLLMGPATDSVEKNLSVISKVGCGIGIAFLVITILTYGLLWSHVKDERSILHLCLCGALIVVYITFMTGIDGTGKKSTCLLAAVVMHYFLLLVFSLLLAEGVELYLQVTVAFSRKSLGKSLFVTPFIACAIIVAVSIGSTWNDGYQSNDFCWLSTSGAIWSFLGPAILVITVNLMIVVLVLRVVLSTHILIHPKYKERAKEILMAICILTSWLGLTWLFGLLAVTRDTNTFSYVFAVFSALQGFLVFVFYCLASKEVRSAFKSKRINAIRTAYSS